MTVANGKAKITFNQVDVIEWGFLAEGYGWLFEITLFPRSLFIGSQTVFNSSAVTTSCFEEDKTIICKEKMSDYRATPGHFDSL